MRNGKTTKTGNTKGSKTPKRTYKKFKENHEKGSKGVGDTIEKITTATGIKAATDYVFDKLGKDCGCDKRRDILNEKFRYEKPLCFEESEYNMVRDAIESRKNKFTRDEVTAFVDIYARVFPKLKRPECTSCSFNSTVWPRLVKLYETYK